MISWFARNGVAANLLMFVIIIGGLASLFSVKQELFPEFSLDTVVVRVPYLGAAPEEVESAVILRIEEALQGVEGIKQIRSSAREGYGSVSVEVRKGADVGKVKDDIKTRVDAISSFPDETERPIVEELLIQRDVLWVAIYGDAPERTLKELAERARDEITELPGVSQAIVQGVRDYEISIEVSEFALQKYNLTFGEIVQAVQNNSIDVPAGSIKSQGGEILLRTIEQAYDYAAFSEIPVRTLISGERITIADVATVRDGFTDEPIFTSFNEKPAALILVREVGYESPISISNQVRKYVKDELSISLPTGIEATAWGDSSFYLKGRLKMLLQNGFVGFLLVMLSLSLFLRPSLAFFVAIGIPVSFLGTFLVAPYIGISVNLISLFAFILVLGIVVDDAIVVGESVFTEFQRKQPGVDSAISGTQRVSTPVTFAILTTIVAFFPVFLLPGQLGKFFAAIPIVVIPTLLFSLVQSKLVLPYHLSLCKVGDKKHRDELSMLSRFQRFVADSLERFVDKFYRPSLNTAIKHRYNTLAAFCAIFIMSMGIIAAGWVKFSPFPAVPSDFIQIDLELPEGTPVEQTQSALKHIGNSLLQIRQEDMAKGAIDPVLHASEFIGFGQGAEGSNRAFYLVELAKSEVRDSSAEDVSNRWREKIGSIPGARRMVINAFAGPPTGLPVDVRLTGRNFENLRSAAAYVRGRLKEFNGLYDIRDTFSEGKKEIKMVLKKDAELLGLTANELATQVRAAFFGAEAQRIQRDEHEVKVMIRYPKENRRTLADLEKMRIITRSGASIPIREVADLNLGEGFPRIDRIDRQRVINVQANAQKDVADFSTINRTLYGGRDIEKSILDSVKEQWPDVNLVKDGEAKDWEETQASLIGGVILVFFLIYTLLAIPFKSYFQPFIVMLVIPFGFTGALFGHWLTGQSLSILSILGIIALTGVVVNDSLVLVDYINRHRREGDPLIKAVKDAGAARFRPIILTSVTTFVGLVPILLERSLQAKFLIPMATSLAFGVLFATFITLILVPIVYLILEDIKRFISWLVNSLSPNTSNLKSRK